MSRAHDLRRKAAVTMDEIRPELARISRRGLFSRALSLGSLSLLTGCDLSTHSGVDAALWAIMNFDDRVQATAIEASGVLRNTDALPTLRSIVANPRNIKSERSALAAIAMMPQPQDRVVFLRELGSKDERLRVSAAEGLARIGNPADEPALAKVWQEEDKMAPRLAAAFALTEARAAEGKTDLTEESPLRYLINTLNSAAYHDVAYSYLVEAARRKPVLEALYTALGNATPDEKIYIARVVMVSGDKSSIPWLEKISRDNQSDVSKEGLRALRSLRARLGA